MQTYRGCTSLHLSTWASAADAGGRTGIGSAMLRLRQAGPALKRASVIKRAPRSTDSSLKTTTTTWRHALPVLLLLQVCGDIIAIVFQYKSVQDSRRIFSKAKLL